MMIDQIYALWGPNIKKYLQADMGMLSSMILLYYVLLMANDSMKRLLLTRHMSLPSDFC